MAGTTFTRNENIMIKQYLNNVLLYGSRKCVRLLVQLGVKTDYDLNYIVKNESICRIVEKEAYAGYSHTRYKVIRNYFEVNKDGKITNETMANILINFPPEEYLFYLSYFLQHGDYDFEFAFAACIDCAFFKYVKYLVNKSQFRGPIRILYYFSDNTRLYRDSSFLTIFNIVEYLLQAGFKFQGLSDYLFNKIYPAISQPTTPQFVNYLLRKILSWKIDLDGNLLLSLCIKSKRGVFQRIKMILANGINPKQLKQRADLSILFNALFRCSLKTVKLAFEHFIDINQSRDSVRLEATIINNENLDVGYFLITQGFIFDDYIFVTHYTPQFFRALLDKQKGRPKIVKYHHFS
jgi:hypothetical protein